MKKTKTKKRHGMTERRKKNTIMFAINQMFCNLFLIKLFFLSNWSHPLTITGKTIELAVHRECPRCLLDINVIQVACDLCHINTKKKQNPSEPVKLLWCNCYAKYLSFDFFFFLWFFIVLQLAKVVCVGWRQPDTLNSIYYWNARKKKETNQCPVVFRGRSTPFSNRNSLAYITRNKRCSVTLAYIKRK